MTDKKELTTNLISSFLILLSCCLLVALLINLRFQQDCATVIVGMLGVCAALYAPIAAFFFYDSWKEQKNYELKKELLVKLSELLSIQYLKIMKHARRADRLKEIENSEICIPNFNEAKSCYDTDLLNEMFSILKIYEAFTDNKSLMQYKENFDNHAFELETFLKNIEFHYSKYYQILEINIESNNTLTKTYRPERKEKVKFNIMNIKNSMEKEVEFENTDDEGKTHRYFKNYDQAHDDFESSYNDFTKEIAKELKL